MKVKPRAPYAGRFAPSPTGPLHFGSLVAALASWLDARAAGGRWLVRMEDLDRPRVVAGASDNILRQLEQLGLDWDGAVTHQSQRIDLYRQALDRLKDVTYWCACSRKEIADSVVTPDSASVYAGTCRGGFARGKSPRAIRLKTEADPIRFIDRVFGPQSQSVEQEVGDFVIFRADGMFAYQLAVVVDDAGQGITDVVRGADLLDSTARQIHLQRLLGLPTPSYLHIPVAVNSAGEKLSKQSGDSEIGIESLRPALEFLGHPAPASVTDSQLLDWGRESWDASKVPRQRSIALL